MDFYSSFFRGICGAVPMARGLRSLGTANRFSRRNFCQAGSDHNDGVIPRPGALSFELFPNLLTLLGYVSKLINRAMGRSLFDLDKRAHVDCCLT